jgi:DNA (cytosine-5)-methyltransferase 1
VRTFYEFFAGGGMARAGLGPGWQCRFANDIDPKKASAYVANWGTSEFKLADIADLDCEDIPGCADLAWASFPCQDLSLAGVGAGLNGKRSGTFWPFWRAIEGLGRDNRTPPLVVLENVCGAITSHGGKDFEAIAEELAVSGYRFGAIVIDAAHFVPQSRPRLFIVGLHGKFVAPNGTWQSRPDANWHTRQLVDAYQRLPPFLRLRHIWWRLPHPPARTIKFSDLVEEVPRGVSWHSLQETKRLIEMMSPLNRSKLDKAMETGARMIGAVYRRTRSEHGGKFQRAEIRFDDIVGCLRTPLGGSSRQTILIVEGATVRSRLLSPRESARLMGLSDEYILPKNYNEAYHLTGDGVVVPVVEYITQHLLNPLHDVIKREARRAA